MRAPRLLHALLCASLFAASASAHGAGLEFPRDGWVTWRAAAVERAPAWCCYPDWKDELRNDESCQLDDGNFGFDSRRELTTGQIRIYARFSEGRLDKLRTLAADCPVTANTAIRELQGVDIGAAVKWLAATIAIPTTPGTPATPRAERRLSSDAMAAIAMYRGDLARDTLAGIARADADREHRKNAMFWLARVRGTEGFDIVAPLIASDADEKVREHAIFAIAQSSAKPAAPLLIRAGTEDRSANVRARAWFWLAQTKAPETEAAIGAALRSEPEQRVREKAVFALSRLRGERGAQALMAVAEDRTLPREIRKKAIFWMSQSREEAAVRYLDRVLAVK